ncbi:hypothetical protein SRABI05_00322 [Agrobacterium fabrum]|uniref:DUF3168 domain-containing protein n=1 Tax=Agrobacterium fabrum TaxID=1176649 RepID=UPI001D357FAB|nr:DUF3168 domain-containing protein [Agrobacterium fabrum]CAH0142105.1 hypothetical protein SRABI05_00322 [Agrobacterium fabrum]CAH0161647.1 hypothetical protein SRABI46_01037 [Agrobacterium fabrum]
MADPTLELQGAIIARLKANAAVTALVGNRIADIPQSTWAKPYISIGPSNYVAELIDCIDGGEIMMQIDCWSESTTMKEIRDIADAVRRALRNWEPDLATNAIVTFDLWRTDFIRDGALKQASLRYTAIVEEP